MTRSGSRGQNPRSEKAKRADPGIRAGQDSEPERCRIIRHPPPPPTSKIIPPEQIAVRAYENWEARGKPAGTNREDWFEADRQLQEEIKHPSLGYVPDKETNLAEIGKHRLSDAIPHQTSEAGGDRLIELYLGAHLGVQESNTIYAARIHAAHLKKTLGDDFAVQLLTTSDFQRHVERRAKANKL